MSRRMQGILLAGCLAGVVTVAIAMAISWGVDHHYCKTGFPTVLSCSVTW